MKKKILILGVTGQDGSYLMDFLIKKNYEVHGLIRKSATGNTKNIDHIINDSKLFNKSFFLHRGDLLDAVSLNNIIAKVQPAEIYNFADQDHVGWSYEIPTYSFRATALSVIEILEILKITDNNQQDSKKIKIPICCEKEYALDLIFLSKKLKIPPNEILDLYLNKEYFCYMTGFIAGMPFLGDIHEKIRFDRLQTPRIKVPKGSIGITEQFCNIYTFESPGGWNIIGNTPLKVFNKLNLNDPSLIKPGDKVSFYKISKQEYLNFNE